jgi:hypothetical protein
VKRLVGQAAFLLVHRLLALALGVVVLASLGLGAGLWRLSQGPINLAWLARKLEVEANQGANPVHLEIGAASLAWEGWRGAVDRPIDLRLSHLLARDTNGREIAVIPLAEVSLALGPLLRGRLAPRAIVLDIEDLHLVRDADGTLALFPARTRAGTARATPLARLAGESSITLAALRRLRLESSKITVIDDQLGLTWRINAAHLDLARVAARAFTGRLDATLAVAGQNIPLAARMIPETAAAGPAARISARIGPLVPAQLAAAASGLAPLKALDAPLSADVTLIPAADLGLAGGIGSWWQQVEAVLALGSGHLALGEGVVPIASGRLVLAADPVQLTLREFSLALAAPAGSANPLITGSGRATRHQDGRLALTLGASLDALPLGDVARYWPAGLADAARAWISTNVTAGRLHDLHLDLTASLAPDGGAPVLERISGGASGDDLTIAWLAPMPPITHGHAVLRLDSADALTIAADAGVVATSAGGAVHLTNGTMHITGLTAKDQMAELRLALGGDVADALALLAHPRLHLLDAASLSRLHDPSGDFTGTLAVKLPLDQHVGIDQIAIDAAIDINKLHLAALLAGRDLDDGAFTLAVNKDGLTASGRARFAGVAARLALAGDFRAGPPDQILARARLEAPIDTPALAGFGIDAGARLIGTLPLTADFISRRNGQGTVSLAVDLTPAAIAPAPLAWRKARGAPGRAQAKIRLDHGEIAAIDHITLEAPDLALEGAADYAHGAPRRLLLSRAEIGATRLHGTLDLPTAPDAPYRLALSGPSLDLSGHLPKAAPAAIPPQAGPTPPAAAAKSALAGFPWQAEIAIDTLLFGPNRRLGFVRGHAEDDGTRLTALQLEGMAQPGDRFRLAITEAPDRRARLLSGEAHDAGALLKTLGVVETVSGGTLSLAGRFDDAVPGHPLAGTLRIEHFTLHDAPLAAKILQDMTLYGLVDELHGNGLQFDQLIAPFHYQNRRIVLDNARMSNASLGFTVKGTIDLATRHADLSGTIIPAYFFNSLLGRLPLVGRLFSPERGGGVLAADYAVIGPLDNPKVTVNPLAALTPGATRGIFNLFNNKTP